MSPIEQITAVASLALGVSLASERLVALATSIIYKSPPVPPAQTDPAEPDDRGKKIVHILLTLTSCALTSWLVSLAGKLPFGNNQPFSIIVLAMLASGGSAFWTSILGYLKAVADIKTIHALKQKLEYKAALTKHDQ